MPQHKSPPKPPSSRIIQEGVRVVKEQYDKLPKTTLDAEIKRFQKVTRRLLGVLIALVLFVPWSAIFFGVTVNVYLGIAIYITSFFLWRYLKKNKVI